MLVVALPHRNDRPLLSVTTALLQAEINIHYVYSMLRVHPPRRSRSMWMTPTLAAQLLIRRSFVLVSESDLAKEVRGRPGRFGRRGVAARLEEKSLTTEGTENT